MNDKVTTNALQPYVRTNPENWTDEQLHKVIEGQNIQIMELHRYVSK